MAIRLRCALRVFILYLLPLTAGVSFVLPARWRMARNASGLPLLAGFCRWAAANQIRVLATFPNIASIAAYDQPSALEVEGQLHEFFAAHGVPLIGYRHDESYVFHRG